MIFKLLGLLDIISGILGIISINFFEIKLAIIFALLSLLKGAYTLLITSNIFDIFGLLDIVPPILFIISTLTGQLIVVTNFALIFLALKGVMSFVKIS